MFVTTLMIHVVGCDTLAGIWQDQCCFLGLSLWTLCDIGIILKKLKFFVVLYWICFLIFQISSTVNLSLVLFIW